MDVYTWKVNYVPLISALIAIVLVFVAIMRKRSKPAKSFPNHIRNQRLLYFNPEPLINESFKSVSGMPLELYQPDEHDPDCLNLAKANYLNMLDKDEIRNMAENCIRSYGVGSCGPRGFYGTIDIHLNLERRIADYMGMEEAVLYSYGFATISSAIGAYCKRSDIIFCDEMISFSARQGLIAARSQVVYFKHNDAEDLEIKLMEKETLEISKKRPFRKFLIIEGIYQRTGAICPLPKLMELRKKYRLRMFIDESLSFGVLGKFGRGITEYFDVNRLDVDMIMGSLEGSIGSIGGFCVGASVIIEHQRLSGLGYCFSASLPPFLSEISILALDTFEKNPVLFSQLEQIAFSVDRALKSLDSYNLLSSPVSPLKVLQIKNNKDSVAAARSIQHYCAEQKMYLSRFEDNLYVNTNIAMSPQEIQKILRVLEDASKFVS